MASRTSHDIEESNSHAHAVLNLILLTSSMLGVSPQHINSIMGSISVRTHNRLVKKRKKKRSYEWIPMEDKYITPALWRPDGANFVRKAGYFCIFTWMPG